MVQSFSIKNFKSFREATLPLAPLTLLIGANASGKSNAIEALQLLSWLAAGNKLGDILPSIREQKLNIRGALADLPFNCTDVSLGCELLSFVDARLRFSISLRVTEAGLRIIGEMLRAEGTGFPASPLYEFVGGDLGGEIRVVGREQGIPWADQQAVFTQLAGPSPLANGDPWSVRVTQAASLVEKTLQMVYFLDPNPRSMRGYSFPQEPSLQEDGAGISSVLYHLVKEQGKKEEVLDFIRALPEQDIRDISFHETPRGEVMVRLHETFGGREVPREAALLSDGTLRALAVATALLSLGEHSTIIIEEIDNGVHPSRAQLILSKIFALAKQRGLRILLTAHNSVLLDALPLEAVPDVIACYRDPEQGDSRLVRLEDLESYPELVAQDSLGRLATRGILDRYLKDPDLRDRAAKVKKGLAWLEDFQRRAQSQ